MGSSNVKDERIGLYIETSKPYYVAGEVVQGKAYLLVKDSSPYSNLTIYVTGQEYVEWGEYYSNGQHGGTTVVYEDKYESYKYHHLVKDFKGTVPRGQYVFPFSIKLPNMMVGSLYVDEECYIKYELKIELVHPSEEKHTQIFNMPLNIIEPPRTVPGPAYVENTQDLKCCGCCMNNGVTKIKLSADKNFVRNGDFLELKALIDNSAAKADLKRFTIQMKQKTIKIADKRTKRKVEKQWDLHEITKPVYAHMKEEIKTTINIPVSITDSTAIGRIVARYFVIHFSADCGCCSKAIKAKLHLIVHSKTPMILEKTIVPPPSDWNPETLPLSECYDLPPFILNPKTEIPYHNVPCLVSRDVSKIKTEESQMMQKGAMMQMDEIGEIEEMKMRQNSYYPDLELFNKYEPTYQKSKK